jgi:hypothetical protein
MAIVQLEMSVVPVLAMVIWPTKPPQAALVPHHGPQP